MKPPSESAPCADRQRSHPEQQARQTSHAPQYFSHSLPPPHAIDEWEPLQRHLDDVSALAAEFCDAFGAAAWGKLAGAWHDLGKYSEEFQQYLLSFVRPEDAGEEHSAPGRVDHSTFGARRAAEVIGGHKGQLLAFCIAGHHAGLPNALPSDAGQERSTLDFRLNARKCEIPKVHLPASEAVWPAITLPFQPSGADKGFQIAFFTRMLFSALIDADRLATEAFCDPALSAERSRDTPPLADLAAELDAYLLQKQAAADPTPVNRLRARVLADCVAAATLSLGFFSLEVPTGGGKTLSSLSFALHHSLAHRLRRVVFAVPFTTIIEQTADEYRKALGPLAERAIIEHHSNIDPKNDTRQNKLAAENWDAPIIVTTNVQLYESLFASSPSHCRKLHRLARSVIVLDEAQTIPVDLLHPTLLALRELVAHYACTVVLCTATQPALQRRDDFPIGIDGVRQIVPNSSLTFSRLNRVSIINLGKQTDDELADRLAAESAALCVVNTRPHASRLYDALAEQVPHDSRFHLSTLMCAQHRRDVLATVRARLRQGLPCRLVSTQLVEAGVDIDFPSVYRAPAGFDSIAQAAGRCNREGRLELGRLFLFDTQEPPPHGPLRSAAQVGRELAPLFDDPLAPNAIEAYFRHLYWSQEHRWDHCEVLPQFDADLGDPRLLRLQFRDAAARYRIIRDDQIPVLVPYDKGARAIRDRLLQGSPADFRLLRETQKYLVGVRKDMLDKLIERNLVLNCDSENSGLWILASEAAYSPEKGLSLEGTGIDPEILIK